MRSYFRLFQNYANFKGFMERGEYWAAMIIHYLVLFVSLYPPVRFILDAAYELPHFYVPWVFPFWCFYFLLTIIPVWSASVRRLHTISRKGWCLLIGLIPVVGWFIVWIWLLQKENYKYFVRKQKQSGTVNELLKRPGSVPDHFNGPRNGVWFFIVFALLAVSGWFLNRYMMQSGTGDAVMAALGDVNTGGLAILNLK